MILMDFALTNAYLHYKMDHPNLEKKYTRSTFMEALQYQMIHVDWAKKVRALNRNDLNEDDDEDDTLSVDKHIDKELEIGIYALKKNTQEKKTIVQSFCIPIALRPKGNKSIDSKRACQICEFEGRGRKVSTTNYCTFHRVRCCTTSYPADDNSQPFIHWGTRYSRLSVKSWDWMCPDTNLTCWEKAHNFYIPNHLFSMEEGTLYNSSTIDLAIVSKVNRKSKLASRKREALFGLVYKNYPSQKLDDGSKKRKQMSDHSKTMDSQTFPETVTSMSTITNSLMSHSIPVPQMEDIMNMSVSSEIESNL